MLYVAPKISDPSRLVTLEVNDLGYIEDMEAYGTQFVFENNNCVNYFRPVKGSREDFDTEFMRQMDISFKQSTAKCINYKQSEAL